jgi:hypothetical protein
VHWALVEGTSEAPILVAADTIAAPATYDDESRSLPFYRERVLLLLSQHSPDRVAVRYAETFGRRAGAKDNQRCRIEGVLIEAASSRGPKIVTGALASISKNLGTKSAKHYLEASDLRGLDWSRYPAKNVREAISVAASALGG